MSQTVRESSLIVKGIGVTGERREIHVSFLKIR